MNRSMSQTLLGTRNSNNEVPKKHTYINQECRNRAQRNQKQKVFHSPYKDGRRNKQYTNPTFMSSNIICQRQFSPFSTNQLKKITVNTEAQNKQRMPSNQRVPCEQRISRSQTFRDISQRVREHSKSIKKKAEKRSQQRADARMNSALQTQLQGLVRFRRQQELKQQNHDPNERFFRKAVNKGKQFPIYLQNFYKNPHYLEQVQDRKRNQVREWLVLQKQLEQRRQQTKRQDHRIEVNTMASNVQNYQAELQQKESLNRKNTQLLNEILLQQIRTKERQSVTQKRERGWKIF